MSPEGRNAMIGMMTPDYFWLAISVPAIAILLVVWKRCYGFGARHWWFFEMVHFIAGFLAAMFLFGLSGSRAVALLGLAAITVIWEILEFTANAAPRFGRWLDRHLGLTKTYYSGWDTLLDIALNFAGAGVFLYLI